MVENNDAECLRNSLSGRLKPNLGVTELMHGKQSRSLGLIRRSAIGVLIAFAAVATYSLCASPQITDRKTFASPEEAATALADACRANNVNQLLAILGPNGREILSSGDAVADKAALAKFANAFEEAHELVPAGEGRQNLQVGAEGWPLPVPLVKSGASWYFDTFAGKEALISRRIESNEQSAIKVCRLYVELQKEYAHRFHASGQSTGVYAQKLRSDPGKHNGLYWELDSGGERSPAGALFELAAQEGYSPGGTKPRPFRGYYFRVLTAQGEDAPGGARSYLDNSDPGYFAERRMTLGFALVAFPARYSASGRRTFIVNHEGIVYQQDLGDQTQSSASEMAAYNPDSSWSIAE